MTLLAPPTPYNWTAGYEPLPADMNTEVRDTMKFLTNKMVFRGWQNTVQSIPNGTPTLIHLDTITEDTYSGWNGSPNYYWQPPYSGWYQVSAAYFSAGVLGGHQFFPAVAVSGGSWLYGEMAPAGTQSGAGISTLIMVYLRGASDYVQLGGWQNTGGAANTFSGGINQASYMEVLWVSE